ncbi:MAG: hypothetical protein P0S94_04905, partial [Simkaniaceae bacterium]|nr:hypothetical protein [Simkaniaceae bacterium]
MMVDPQSLSYPQFSRRFDLGVRIVLSLIALATLCSLWFFIPKRLGDLSFSSEKKGVVSDLSCDHCVVDSPAVSILPEHERKYLPNLSREIALVNVSSRPDSNVP